MDEAHCCSQYGHDFRTGGSHKNHSFIGRSAKTQLFPSSSISSDYAKLGVLHRLFPTVPMLAVTATATPALVRDVSQILEMGRYELFRSSFNRPNLYYEVISKPKTLDATVDGEWCVTDCRALGIETSGLISLYSPHLADIVEYINQNHPTFSGIGKLCLSTTDSYNLSSSSYMLLFCFSVLFLTERDRASGSSSGMPWSTCWLLPCKHKKPIHLRVIWPRTHK